MELSIFQSLSRYKSADWLHMTSVSPMMAQMKLAISRSSLLEKHERRCGR